MAAIHCMSGVGGGDTMRDKRPHGTPSPNSLFFSVINSTEEEEDQDSGDDDISERPDFASFDGDEEMTGANDVKKQMESSKSLVVAEGGRDPVPVDGPPKDDCCPICFETFRIACKTSCGHWFCANCILQFWSFRAVLKQCKCPICCQLISKLTPEVSLQGLQENEVMEVLRGIEKYNRLFVGGIYGFTVKVLESPMVIRRMFMTLMDPDRFRLNYYMMRFVALLLSVLYNISHFDFIPTGGLGVRRLFDLCAIALVVILFLVGICRRMLLRRRVRIFAAMEI